MFFTANQPLLLRYYYYYHHYYIDKRIYLNLSKSTQSAAGLKALKSAANGRYLTCKSLSYCFRFNVQKYIYPPVSTKVHAGSFRVSVIPPNSDMDYRIRRAYVLMRAYTHEGAHRQRVSTTFLKEKLLQFFLVLRTGFETIDRQILEVFLTPSQPERVTLWR